MADLTPAEVLAARLDELTRQLRGDGAPPHLPGRLGRWLDLRINVGTMLTIAVMVGAAYVQLQRVELETQQNAKTVDRVEFESKERDRDLGARLDKSLSDHMQYQHGGRRSHALGGPPALPSLMSAHGGGR